MAIQDRIVAYLAEHPEGVDDDGLTAALGLRQRQQANLRCRRLERFGFVTRRKVGSKIRNFLNAPETVVLEQQQNADSVCNERPWYWEGNVQAAVVRHLNSVGYRIVSSADTAAHQPGKDIVAITPSGDTLWVSAKGYPTGTPRTNPHTQARHWFAHAVFDLVLWHDEDATVALALALPDQATYRKLANRAVWFLSNVKARIYWVAECGSVVEGWPKLTGRAAAAGL